MWMYTYYVPVHKTHRAKVIKITTTSKTPSLTRSRIDPLDLMCIYTYCVPCDEASIAAERTRAELEKLASAGIYSRTGRAAEAPVSLPGDGADPATAADGAVATGGTESAEIGMVDDDVPSVELGAGSAAVRSAELGAGNAAAKDATHRHQRRSRVAQASLAAASAAAWEDLAASGSSREIGVGAQRWRRQPEAQKVYATATGRTGGRKIDAGAGVDAGRRAATAAAASSAAGAAAAAISASGAGAAAGSSVGTTAAATATADIDAAGAAAAAASVAVAEGVAATEAAVSGRGGHAQMDQMRRVESRRAARREDHRSVREQEGVPYP